ncbi:MAG: putative quinol monooxygenase [Burkholderiales bacterium]
MVHVIATVELAPGTREKFLSEFRNVIPAVRAEAGCIEYGPAVDADTDIPIQFRIGADKVVVIEKWESVASLKAHVVAPHMQTYRAKVKDCVRGMELRVLTPA